MGSFTGKLLLIFVIFLYSIELISSQSSPPRPSPVNWTSHQNGRVRLPPPYEYDTNGRIRARGHPNALPVMHRGAFCGMTDGVHFFPIYVDGKMYIIDLNRHRYIEVQERERKAFLKKAKANMNEIIASTRNNNNQ